ncbi:MAG: SDR family oxidoreductase, partial [Eubacteriales bacterium]
MLIEKVALITGAARGIGAECAMRFAEEGAKVIIIDMDEARGTRTAEGLCAKGQGAFFKADVSNEEEVEALFQKIKKEYGKIDILMNNAGITSTRTIFEESMQSWDKIMNVNLKGAFLCTREAFLIMLENGFGKVINMASISGQLGGIRTSPAYAASKAGVL